MLGPRAEPPDRHPDLGGPRRAVQPPRAVNRDDGDPPAAAHGEGHGARARPSAAVAAVAGRFEAAAVVVVAVVVVVVVVCVCQGGARGRFVNQKPEK